MRKVRPGESLQIPAKAYNAFVDAARYVRDLQHSIGGAPLRATHGQTIVLVKNASGSDLPRFGVLEITGVVFSPTDDADGFKSGPVLSGVAPSGNLVGNFVVAMDPIAAGELGRAVVGGLSVAYLNVIDAAHEYADTASGVTATLRTCPAGAARIIWKESGTGSKWAVVRIGNHGPAGLWGKATALWVSDGTATGNGCYVNVNPCQRDGTGVDASVTHKVWLPRNGRREDPNVRADDVIAYQHEPGGDFVNPSGSLDGKVNETVRIHLDAGNIPAGWSIVDKGKFYVGYDDGDSDYDAVGKTGGFKKHGDTENDHPGHEDHTHPLPTCQPAVAGSAGNLLNGIDTGAQNEVFAHTGDADNRPPYQVVVWIGRTS